VRCSSTYLVWSCGLPLSSSALCNAIQEPKIGHTSSTAVVQSLPWVPSSIYSLVAIPESSRTSRNFAQRSTIIYLLSWMHPSPDCLHHPGRPITCCALNRPQKQSKASGYPTTYIHTPTTESHFVNSSFLHHQLDFLVLATPQCFPTSP